MKETNSIIPVFENIQSSLIEQLSLAEHSIYIAVAWITNPTLISLIDDKAKAGLDIKIILSNHEFNNPFQFNSLKEEGVEIAFVGENKNYGVLMHNKFCVIDKTTVVSGSYNWSKMAAKHFENVTIINDGTVAIKFLKEFNRIIDEHENRNSVVGRVRNRFNSGINKIKGINAPTIKNFKTNTTFLSANTPITFSWQLGGEHTDVFLNDERVTGLTQKTIYSAKETQFILKAINRNFSGYSNNFQAESKPIQISVDNTPVIIHSFESDLDYVKDGATICLSWEVENAVKVEIAGIGLMNGNEHEVTPTKSTIYQLKTYAFNGTYKTAEIRIKTDTTAPQIVLFKADRSFVKDKTPLHFFWEVIGAASVQITELGWVNGEGEGIVYPKTDKRYQLKAISHYGVESIKEFPITVSKLPPIIRSFITDKSVLMDEQPAYLSWQVENVETLSIDQNIGEVTNQRTASVHNMEDTVYTLKAISYFGTIATKNLTIEVNKVPPLIHFFQSDKAYVLVDFTINLSWEITGARKVSLKDIGTVNSIGSQSVNIEKDTPFQITAANYFGYESTEKLLIRIVPIPLMEKLLIPDVSIELTTQLSYYHPTVPTIQLPTVELISDKLNTFNQSLIEHHPIEEILIEEDKASISGFLKYLKNESMQLRNTINQLKQKS